MPTKIEFDAGGVKWHVEGPATAEEFDTTYAKKVGACLECGNADVIYRRVSPIARDLLIEAITKKYGITQKTVPHPEGKKNTDGTPVMIVDKNDGGMKFINRAAAELGYDDPSQFQPLADEILAQKDDQGAPLLTFDASERAAGGGAVLGKTFIEDAKAILNESVEKRDRAIERLAVVNGNKVVVTGALEKDAEALGMAIRDYKRNLKSALLA